MTLAYSLGFEDLIFRKSYVLFIVFVWYGR